MDKVRRYCAVYGLIIDDIQRYTGHGKRLSFERATARQCFSYIVPTNYKCPYGASIRGDINQRRGARFRLYSVVLLTKHTMLYYEAAE